MHCAVPSNDGLIYVCDRVNDRIQIFKEDGTFVKEMYLETNTRGDGSAWEIAFSKDPNQKYMYVADGSEREHPHLRARIDEGTDCFRRRWTPARAALCRARIATNSKGDIFTTETSRSARAEVPYKGIGPSDRRLYRRLRGPKRSKRQNL